MRKLCLGTVGVLAMTLLIASIALLVARVLQKAVDLQVKEETVLRNGTDIFKVWEEPPPPIYIQFYFFNLTNPLEVLEGETPIMKQAGPYTYREHKPRVNIHILENGTKVSSVNPKTYFFEPEMSVGDPKVDLIRSVNVPALVGMDMATETSFHLPVEFLLLLYQENMFTMHTVHELLWGYQDKFLSTLHKIRPNIDEDFGYFKKMNGTDDGEYVVLSGEKNYLDFTRIVEWNGKHSLDWWSSPTSNMINGTDGDTFHPLLSTDETIYVFVSDFCRSVYLNFDSYVSVDGIPAYRFRPPLKLFGNLSINPDNAGFCVPAGNCLGTGLLNVSACRQGAPIILSPPHFYQSDEVFVKDIDGLHPNEEEHGTFLDINPLTGLLVRAARRTQINVYVKKLPDFVQTGNIRTLVLPVLYLNESVVLDKASADKLKTALLQSSVITSIPYIIMAIGIIFGIVFVVLACRPVRETEEGREVLIDPE
ncbi:lysosome membrane protein 2 isoform X2 [Hemicordylus capensis]|uniref:lysosome membrane protein 2 isoform X2 n=1 Tax=Hemicordylus capensis TaxID=884348 RepID=UPI002303E0B8|nr:lysosome membrane protein 2 isoform X2 [Hemicordylus capensis]